MKNSIIITILLCSVWCYAQDTDCSKFRTGQFRYLDKDYKDLMTIRTDSTQIDSYPAPMNFQGTSRVKWLSDCSYEFEYYKFNDPKYESLLGTKYTIKIVEIKGDTIVCQKVVNGQLTQRQEMIKIKD
ncbi:hypothetical protein [uncultured Psychroserpens sp.]|uniref:hypothetical protein n=1 Tax=uncultured Psychroserpens sp. TaxID=255436 RepID=UPI00262A67FE|nr:hypothetical protein [uncultured Psychroserpens sp.]